MKKLLLSLMAVSLSLPSVALSQSQGGKSATQRQDTVRGAPPFDTRGECERAAQRANQEFKKEGSTTRNKCVEQDGRFFIVVVDS